MMINQMLMIFYALKDVTYKPDIDDVILLFVPQKLSFVLDVHLFYVQQE